ncbi:hypothetical protein ATCM_01975 [Stenotrophomonas sp. ATCM1_4]|uniref:hypothetical protein n=1 Tax=Stenotrophomonas sp. ATCM1_4 TaxID=2259330 RepID=UPI00104E987D|nr:hypothetical protein [Stenotrophomonas sp. ATCM1_4]TDB26520.1 hypothetical protein ATCM_01975 [Stenotrophomonas sp. ATCM1_4]
MARSRWTCVVMLCASFAAAAAKDEARTKVIVLGVDHAGQLVAPADSPAHLAAFLARADPDAICIERSPEEFARNSYYEFTYEIQDVAVPFARENGIVLCPVDWQPSAEDARLGFDLDLSSVPEVRPESGYQQFLSFAEPAQLRRTLFHADNPDNTQRIVHWATTPAVKAEHDLPRRMYLYRTFLQAKRLASAAKARPGSTVVLIVGEFHKRDIESILSTDAGIEIVQPSALGNPTRSELAAAWRRDHYAAIATFNLLGVQADTGNIDHEYVGNALISLEKHGQTPETRLLQARAALLAGRMGAAEAIDVYQRVAQQAGTAAFTWTGVQDRTRLDSYFDPFGNLTVRQRALLEVARERARLGDADQSDLRRKISSELSTRQAIQLAAYWDRYISGSGQTGG